MASAKVTWRTYDGDPFVLGDATRQSTMAGQGLWQGRCPDEARE